MHSFDSLSVRIFLAAAFYLMVVLISVDLVVNFLLSSYLGCIYLFIFDYVDFSLANVHSMFDEVLCWVRMLILVIVCDSITRCLYQILYWR